MNGMGISLKGKRAIVTGGARGMGEAVVRAYAEAGASVASLDRSDHVHEGLDSEARARMHEFHCDVSDEKSVNTAISEAVARLGGLDILVNVAGGAAAAYAAEMTVDEWDRVLAVNARGTFLTNKAVFPHLKTSGGKILNFGSISRTGMSGMGHYAASKGAVQSWSLTIAKEWAPYGIKVNVIAPAVDTPGARESVVGLTNAQMDEYDAWMHRAIPLRGALGDMTRDFVPYMIFLASDGADYITGATINIDGGMIYLP